MSFSANEFICLHTQLVSPSLVPEMTLHLATEVTPLWEMTQKRLQEAGVPPPYWAFAWPGGQGLARYFLDKPEIIQGKRILDFAAGSGVASIAAMKAGALHVAAAEIDPLANAAIQLNALHNRVSIEKATQVDMDKPYLNVDFIVAGDVCYQQGMATQMMQWLRLCHEKGTRILLADPGRAYVPTEGLIERGRYDVPTSRDLEDRDMRTVIIWEMV